LGGVDSHRPRSGKRFDTLEIVEQRDATLIVALNRPTRLNAMTFQMFDELIGLRDYVDSDTSVRVLVITGSGRGFCSGLDLDDAVRLSSMSASEMLTGQQLWARAVAGFRTWPTPVIAAVNGPAAGAGLALALSADIRIAAPEASFNAAFVRVGLTGGDVGTSWMLPRIVGFGHASELLLTGRIVDAGYAERIGLVNAIVPADELLDAACQVAAEICANTPLGVRLTKQVLQTNVDAPSLEAAIELENRNQVLATRTNDMVEALNAFREKRSPNFSDR
jgi:enoyl-CoA hydratase/carnithine racemase